MQGFAAPKWAVDRKYFLPLKKNPVIRVIKGDQFACFTSSSQERFFADTFRVTANPTGWGTVFKEKRSNSLSRWK